MDDSSYVGGADLALHHLHIDFSVFFYKGAEWRESHFGECQQSKQQLATNGIDSVGEVIFVRWKLQSSEQLPLLGESNVHIFAQRHPTGETK
jgi:hypothetical protein